jgi:hypothetical protein
MAQIPIDTPDIIEELKQARGQMMQGPHGTLFWHSYANGVPMSKTEVWGSSRCDFQHSGP